MKILAIETSCDETSIAVLEFKDRRFRILADVISSQVKVHRPFGGVVPNLAAREHEKNLPVTLELALKQNLKRLKDIDYFAVTVGPGLAPALAQGVKFAKKLAKEYQKPLIPVNHLNGHLWSNLIPELHNKWQSLRKLKFPAVCLIISGGHTELLLMKNIYDSKLVGSTLDDAAGEAFDKVARLLGLAYPGGPEIEKLARKGNPQAINFPRPMIHQKNYNFSFAGLKTAVLYYAKVSSFKFQVSRIKADIAASFQQAVIDVLIMKTMRAVGEYQAKTILLGGGVSANQAIVGVFRQATNNTKHATRNTKQGIDFFVPPLRLSTDNAVMIALAAYLQLDKIKKQGKKLPWKIEEIDIDANLGI